MAQPAGSSSSSSSPSSSSSSSSSLLATPSAAPLPDAPDELLCPIKFALFDDPVIAADGHNYERKSIERWLQNHATSPKTNIVLPHKHLIPNHELRARCLAWKESHCTEAGLKKQLKRMSGEVTSADNPPAALVAVRAQVALRSTCREISRKVS